MAHSSMQRYALRATFAGVLLMSASVPAMAGYKVLIKGPVCTGPNYCASDEITGSGPVSITLPAYNNPDTAGNDMPQSRTFEGNVTLQTVESEICKPGTNGQPEWLKAGSNVKGVTGTLESTQGNYTLVLSFSAVAASPVCNTANLGNESLTYVRGYTLSNNEIFANGSHHVYNVAAIPEPETLLLLMAGLGAMGAVAWRRGKPAKRGSA